MCATDKAKAVTAVEETVHRAEVMAAETVDAGTAEAATAADATIAATVTESGDLASMTMRAANPKQTPIS